MHPPNRIRHKFRPNLQPTGRGPARGLGGDRLADGAPAPPGAAVKKIKYILSCIYILLYLYIHIINGGHPTTTRRVDYDLSGVTHVQPPTQHNPTPTNNNNRHHREALAPQCIDRLLRLHPLSPPPLPIPAAATSASSLFLVSGGEGGKDDDSFGRTQARVKSL